MCWACMGATMWGVRRNARATLTGRRVNLFDRGHRRRSRALRRGRRCAVGARARGRLKCGRHLVVRPPDGASSRYAALRHEVTRATAILAQAVRDRVRKEGRAVSAEAKKARVERAFRQRALPEAAACSRCSTRSLRRSGSLPVAGRTRPGEAQRC